MGKSQSEGFVAHVVQIIVRERRRQGMSHERLAKTAGVHRSTVSRTESGAMSPTLRVLHAMATALHLRLSDVTTEAEKAVRRKAD
ncbi:MAG: helix-turn-helix domain-containing protein [Verrucomicrobia bacterium]|nr:helix-turn-helix domain-containing protein [Verrucomicrobiota bacterium]